MKNTKSLSLSVVIPVGTGSDVLPEVIESLNKQSRKPEEIIIVNDRVKDKSLDCVENIRINHIVVKTQPDKGRYGVSSARNIGAENSSSDIILFLDSDVILPDNYISDLMEIISDIDGILGVQSADCGYENFASVFKNLWMRYTYIKLKKKVIGLFYTSSAAIRRKSFNKTGGFDEEYRVPGVEDTIFGNKLLNYNIKIRICETLEFIHKKYYTVKSALITDFTRSKQLTLYFIKTLPSPLNRKRTSVPIAYFLSIPSIFLGLITFILSFWHILFILLSIFFFLIPNFFTFDFLKFIYKTKGAGFSVKSLFYQYLVFIFSGTGIFYGIVLSIFKDTKG
jgi:glycosyltransferase involved in cell wall biosynthesis